MKPVMMLGVMIVIISTLFIMMIFNTLVMANIKCLGNPENPAQMKCNLKRFNIDVIFGLMLVGFFTVLDIGALYLVLTAGSI